MQNLPSVSDAKLPQTYQNAKTALSECSRIDECLEWGDKAEALASYARQAKDDTMRQMADRIQARAIRRAGELLKQIEPSKGGDSSLFNAKEGDRPSVTRKQAATDAGMSEHQRKQALRVASVPAPEFERQVESDSPPTVTKLAEQGKKRLVDLDGISASTYKKATHAGGTIKRMAEMCQTHDPREMARGFKPHEIERLRGHVQCIDEWLDLFVTNL